MKKLISAVSKVLPKRRGRSWRYVSPRRRGLAALMLALLVTLTFAYWHFTNDRRIRHQAEKFLRDLTGGHVKLHSASFSFFGGVKLDGVRVDLDVDGVRKPFFHAKTVILRHKPWSLFVGGRLEPVEVICSSPAVTLPHGLAGIAGFLPWKSRLGGERWLGQLPKISIRQGRLSVVDVETGVPLLVSESVEVSMIPSGRDLYTITFDGKQTDSGTAMWGKFTLDIASREVKFLAGSVPIQGLDEALPRKYRKWRRRYKVTGNLVPKSASAAGGGPNLLVFDLLDVALKLPRDEGGLGLQNMTGTLRFDENGVTVHDVSGRIVETGGARFTLTGRYDGFEPDSPFELSVRLEDMVLPEGELAGALGELLSTLKDNFKPQGKFNLTATLRRQSGGVTSYEGIVELGGMSILYRRLPYQLTDVTGTIAFVPGRAELRGLVGRHGPTYIEIGGFLTGLDRGSTYDVTLRVADGSELILDDELRQAIPRRFVKIWDAVNLSGSAGGRARVYRAKGDTPQSIDVQLDLHGNTSMSYVGFPYPLESLFGRIEISNGDVQIRTLRGTKGPMGCRIAGSLADLDSPRPKVDLRIRAWRAPIDDIFLTALARLSPKASATLSSGGTIEDLDAHITRAASDEQLSYRLEVALRRARFVLQDFPYTVTDASGKLTIEPRRMTVHTMRGMHGRTPITVSGLVHLGSQPPGFDLEVLADELRLDDDLFAALPPNLKDLWRKLGLDGTVDMELSIQRNVPGLPVRPTGVGGGFDYRVLVNAKSLQLRYSGFPYTLSGLSGRVVATPGLVVLENLAGQKGRTKTLISGRIDHASSGMRATLSVTAENLPLDEELLGALPGELAPLLTRLRTGGSCSAKLRKLSFAYTPASARSPPTTGPATRPSDDVTWDLDGEISFEDVVVDLGFGPKKLSGRLDGVGGWTRAGLKLDAAVDLASIQIGKRSISELSGRLMKSPTSGYLIVKDLLANAHGGRVAGYAEILLAEPLQYGIRLDVQGVRLEELFPKGSSSGRSPARGVLDGRLELTTVAGQPERRRGAGVIRISKASIYQLPVVLGFLHVIYIALPGESALADGYLTYRVRGDRLIFDEIHLSGPAMSFVGSGTVNLGTDRLALNLFAYTGPPGKLPRIAGLDELLSGIIRELMEVQVRGTLANPQYRTVPLRSLDAAIRRLVTPGEEDQ